jgi:hypothetical protein
MSPTRRLVLFDPGLASGVGHHSDVNGLLLPPLLEPAGEFAQARVCCEPATGRLLLFPAWLWHEVEQSTSDQPRICVSFNVGMKPL